MRHEIEQIAQGIQVIRREITTRPGLAENQALADGVQWIHTMMALTMQSLWEEIKRTDPAARKVDYEVERVAREMNGVMAARPRHEEED